MTQLGNERTYVDAGELSLNDPARRVRCCAPTHGNRTGEGK